jgi:hypothetical protein
VLYGSNVLYKVENLEWNRCWLGERKKHLDSSVDFEIRVLKYSSFDNNGYPIFWLCELLQSSDLVSENAECVQNFALRSAD